MGRGRGWREESPAGGESTGERTLPAARPGRGSPLRSHGRSGFVWPGGAPASLPAETPLVWEGLGAGMQVTQGAREVRDCGAGKGALGLQTLAQPPFPALSRSPAARGGWGRGGAAQSGRGGPGSPGWAPSSRRRCRRIPGARVPRGGGHAETQDAEPRAGSVSTACLSDAASADEMRRDLAPSDLDISCGSI